MFQQYAIEYGISIMSMNNKFIEAQILNVLFFLAIKTIQFKDISIFCVLKDNCF